jgi:hypothetical protein
MQPLRDAMAILADLDGDWRRPLPDDVPQAMSSAAGVAMS